jgi:hypothetical protein
MYLYMYVYIYLCISCDRERIPFGDEVYLHIYSVSCISFYDLSTEAVSQVDHRLLSYLDVSVERCRIHCSIP